MSKGVLKVGFFMQDRRAVYGAERAVADLAQALVQDGRVCAEIILIRETRLGAVVSDFARDLAQRGLRTHELPADSAFSLGLVRVAKALFTAQGFDVIHTVGYKPNLHAALVLHAGKVSPLVSTVHGWLFRNSPKERFYECIERQVLKRISSVVVLSNHYRVLLAQCGVPADRLHLIPSGLSPASMIPVRSAPMAGNGLVVGMLGRFSEEKGHRVLLEAVRRLGPTVPIRFLLAGEGPMRESVQSMVRSLGLEGRVEVIGYTDTRTFFSRVDVLALCSTMENLPYSVLEAMSGAIPVIASRVGGLPDLVEHGVTGFLFSPGSADELAGHLRQIAANPALVRTMGFAAREKFMSQFSLQRCVDEHVALYRRLCPGKEVT